MCVFYAVQTRSSLIQILNILFYKKKKLRKNPPSGVGEYGKMSVFFSKLEIASLFKHALENIIIIY